MARRCVVIQDVEEGEELKSKGRVSSRRCRTEMMFPMYAMGSFKPNSIARTILDTAGDPIWDSVRADARFEADKEQILSSFLYASVLSHDCFERSLGFVLANRLQNATLLATQLMDIFDDVMMNDRGIQRSIRLDAQAFKDRDPACASYSWALLYLKGYHSLQSYRIAHALWNRGRKILALALQSRISELQELVREYYWIMEQGVTLGGTGKEVGDRHPKIGQGALIGASATVLGNIVIGEGAMIAAGSLVLKDVPPHSMAVGNPAKIVGYIQDEDPSLTMKHDAGKDYFEHVAASSSDGLNNGIHCSGRKS
ncbi:Serine acetyltransferase, N-terminal [Musa troglodytarum]|uniref:serine O-acetyltransferase n=1 Tax=Musa troglodytarum TaxID=320322 RepID=A0A9E7G3E8_9LILI|nr:Serine acetyltransferase, N-terminal [Musa troglodytarum]